MQEKIYTIPVNEAFEQTDECPFCVMYNKLESNEIDLITGASMMEPDIRIKTNELGFCREHFAKMFAKPQRLPLALTLQTHLDELRKDVRTGALFGDPAAKVVKRLEKLEHDCYVCQRIDRHFPRMIETACSLFENEREFRDKFLSQKFFCLPHYKLLLEAAKRVCSKKAYPELVKAADAVIKAYMDSLYDDVSLFAKKFDYNYRDTPWGTAKDSVERTIKFLTSDKG